MDYYYYYFFLLRLSALCHYSQIQFDEVLEQQR